jgi:hypothetical protein
MHHAESDKRSQFGPRLKEYRIHGASILLIALLLARVCCAQVDRSGLTGAVTDLSGRALVETHVTAIDRATALRRETVSDARGNYSILGLAVGVYTVTFEHPGFKTMEFVDVEQVIGRTRTLDAILQVAGNEERINVSTASALLDRNSSALTGLIERTQADELPLNGRNWSTLTAFVPGAVDTGGSNQRTIRFAGRGTDDENYTYDGVDATNVVNQAQRPWVRLAIPLDAIQEFRVDSLMSTAESGGTGGPQLAVSSPSGTNQLHGRAFEYLRNDVFDAAVPEWASGGKPQEPLRLNQFGGSLGGPVVRDKTYFFLASEAYRQNWGYPVIGYVPDPAFRQTVPSSSPIYTIINAYPVAGPRTALTPTSGPGSDPNVDQISCQCTQVVNENSAMLRMDQRSANTTGFMRFNYDRSVNTQPFSVSATDLQQQVSAPVNGALELLHIFSRRLVNEIKFGFNRATSNTYSLGKTDIPYQLVVTGLSTQNYNRVSISVGNSFSWIDNLTWIHGRQTVKAGAEIRRIQMNQGNTINGKITFSSVENLAANKVQKATLNQALPVNGLRKTDYIGFVQDEFKLRSNLTANLGVRYSFFDLFHEVNGKSNPFDFATCGPQGFCGVGASFGQRNYGDVDPRLAFAWSPRQNGKTVIRAGFGMYHEDGQLDDQNLPNKNEVQAYSLSSRTTPNLSYPIDSFLSGPGTISPQDDDRRRKDTYVEQWSLSAQHALPADFVGTLSYVGSRGVHLMTISAVNMINPETGVAQYPEFAPAIGWRSTNGSSTYHGLSLAGRRAFSSGFLVAANYMWSHEIDDGSNGSGDGDSQVPQNVRCQACERASGNWDARHVFNGNAVYQLPFGPGRTLLNQRGIASSIAGNWQLTTTALARTGFPVNVLMPSGYTAPDGNSGTQRPDRVPGVPLAPPGGRSVAQWINPAAFATPAGEFGNTPRNVVRGPGTWQIDFGAGKVIPITERAQIEFRSEFYNIFNHPQLGPPQAALGSAGFGRIQQTVNTSTPVSPVGSGTPREMQFALRLEF